MKTLIGFFMISVQVLLLHNFQKHFLQSNQKSGVSVYLFNKDYESVGKKIQKSFCKESFVKKCTLRSPKEAKKVFLQNNSELKAAVDSLDKNPFPPSLEVELDDAHEKVLEIQSFLGKLKKQKGIDFVDDGEDWVLQWFSFVRLFSWGSRLICLLFALAAIFIISNAVSLLVYSHRDEVEILSIVGATDSFIRGPFVLQGILQACTGALLALMVLWFSVWIINTHILPDYQSLFVGSLYFLPTMLCFFIMCVGLVLGGIGSYFSVNRFLV